MSHAKTPAELWAERLPTGSARLIDGVKIARTIEAEVARETESLRRSGRSPHLATIQVGQDPATDLYIRNQKARFKRMGIRFTFLSADPGTESDGILAHIEDLNGNPSITGIMITSPLPDELSANRLRQAIVPEKDVEGLHPFNLGNLIYARGTVGPCTALAVLEALRSCEIDLAGRHAVIVGHSDTVGKPVTLRLLQDLVTTTTCHIATRDLGHKTLEADILIVAVGKAGLIQKDMVKPGAIVIDVGINEVADAGTGKGAAKIVGDVDFTSVAETASWITPVPGGIGPITVAMLAKNTILCARRQA